MRRWHVKTENFSKNRIYFTISSFSSGKKTHLASLRLQTAETRSCLRDVIKPYVLHKSKVNYVVDKIYCTLPQVRFHLVVGLFAQINFICLGVNTKTIRCCAKAINTLHVHFIHDFPKFRTFGCCSYVCQNAIFTLGAEQAA